ncbi:MAG: DEAD/DEAH box helicase family protein [archaeon]
MIFKKYQEKAIEELKTYISEIIKRGDPDHAFYEVKNREIPYNGKPFKDVPFVCMKIPTGGGKTLVAAQSVVEIMSSYSPEKRDKGIVLWFCPNDAIKSQTLKKLKDTADIHRKVLNEYFGKDIKIFSNEEALSIKRHEVEDNLCIIVASLDAFRKGEEKRDKYKVYQESGSLIDHFDNLQSAEGLKVDEEGEPIYSLSNVIQMNNPLVIVDEGHRTKTTISETTLFDLNPSFVLEFTATPREGSNILVDIHAGELREEDMVKLPIVLETHKDWRDVIDKALEQRQMLEVVAKKDKGKIRPIMLLQAQSDKGKEKDVTVDKIKEYLLKKKIPEGEIAIKTSKQNDIEGIDLLKKACKIRYIITIAALAEGWDCPFAYVLASVSNVGAKVAVEQIIGRVIRMPFAQKREVDDLNMSYVFSSAESFSKAADQIVKGLKDNGYEAAEEFVRKKGGEDEFFEDKKAKRVAKAKLEVPIFSFNGEPLSFDDLLDEKFDLTKRDHKLDYTGPTDEDAVGYIDLDEREKWISKKIRQAKITDYLRRKGYGVDENTLATMIDDKIKRSEIGRKERVTYIKKIIDYLVREKDQKIYGLFLNMPHFRQKVADKIKLEMETYAKDKFNEHVKSKKVNLDFAYELPEEIEISEEMPVKYNKHYYDKVDKVNKEEKSFIDKLHLNDGENIESWVRCREKKADAVALQGWENRRFYPDFLAVTKKRNIILFEWKGGHLLDSPAVNYKEELGKVWEKLGRGKLHFFLVHNGNVDDVLDEVKGL